MLPSSNARAYLIGNANGTGNRNVNEILTKEKATSISKTMSKFYKKPKDVIPIPSPVNEMGDKVTTAVSPKKEFYGVNENNEPKKIKKNKKHTKKDKTQKEVSRETEELNYIGDKDDLSNIEFLFREATGYEIDDARGDENDTGDTGTDDKDDEDDEDDEDDGIRYRENRENREKYEKRPKILYPFSHKNSSHFSQNYKDDDFDSSDILVEFVIYRINNYAYKPFLEFMLYKADTTFYLPNLICNPSRNFESGSGSGSGSESDTRFENQNIYDKVISTLDTIFADGNYKIKGRLVPSNQMNLVDKTYVSERYILFVECVLGENKFDEEENEETNFTPLIPEKTKLWWITISEIFNYRKVLFFAVHDSVVNLFYSYPEMMNIFAGGKLLEIPIVVYNGNNDNNVKYNAVFSLKKSSQFSRYGPFYYFTDLHSSFKYACYDVDGNMHKVERGGLLRTILFPLKIKMFLERDKLDTSIMAHHVFEEHPEKINTGQFRDNDAKWVKKYNTAYNGEYMIVYDRGRDNDRDAVDESMEDDNRETRENREKKEYIRNNRDTEKIPFPVMFCISDYKHQQVISYHYVDTQNIPAEYSYDFKDYKLL
jgi:hypothetical protein